MVRSINFAHSINTVLLIILFEDKVRIDLDIVLFILKFNSEVSETR
jgi:hypothetical protein